jgi:hypothetical protein
MKLVVKKYTDGTLSAVKMSESRILIAVDGSESAAMALKCEYWYFM